MNARNLLLLSLLGTLAACQPEQPPASDTQTKAATAASTEPAPMAQPVEQPAAATPAAEPAAATPAPATSAKQATKPAEAKPAESKTAPTPAPTAETKPATTAAPATTVETKPVASSAQVTTMPAEAAKCKACHAIDKRVVGPGWKDVAVKRNGDKAAILANIKKGGSFGWGMGQMPPRGMESDDAKLEKLAEFIAGLK